MSDIGSILLHVDATPASRCRLELTRQLAARLDGRITAVFGASRDDGRSSYAYSASALLAARDDDTNEMALDAARSDLQRHTSSEGPPVAWCDAVGDTITHGFLQEAAYADLVVIGQQQEPATWGEAPDGFVESTILSSGRPTLVIPPAPRASSIGLRVLVAWDGSVPAARALTASLPFLTRADEVHVATWSSAPCRAPFSAVDVVDYLRGHYVEVRRLEYKSSRHVASELASLAAELDADLVVMGCYGHSRARERVFGGTSRAALRAMPVPLLMAH